MSYKKNLHVFLFSRPQGKPKKENFLIKEDSIPSIKEGEVLARTIYLSLDPYMRGRMNSGKSYANPVETGEVMVGGTVGMVIDSKNSDYIKGDFVFVLIEHTRLALPKIHRPLTCEFNLTDKKEIYKENDQCERQHRE